LPVVAVVAVVLTAVVEVQGVIGLLVDLQLQLVLQSQ